MERLTSNTFEILDLETKFSHLRGWKNLSNNVLVRSSHKVIESFDSPANHLVASPVIENGNNPNLIDSWEIFLNTKVPHTSLKFLR